MTAKLTTNQLLESKLLHLILCLVFISFANSSCSSSQQQQEEKDLQTTEGDASAPEGGSDEVTTEDRTLDSDDEDSEGLSALSAAMGEGEDPNLFSDNPDAKDRPFPKFNSSWEVQSHILSFKQPEESFLSQCKNEIKQMTATSRNHDSLIMASSQFQSVIRPDPKSYHWCFFHVVKDLDVFLEKTGVSFDQKMNTFLTTMNELWVFSSALTKVTNDQKYIKFTKERYVTYSSQYFGRNLETIGRPLSH
jgi:hypothetical protein